MYWNFVAIDGVIKNQINTQEDATLKGKKKSQIASRLIRNYEWVGNGYCLVLWDSWPGESI
jgi:hypothetical protein